MTADDFINSRSILGWEILFNMWVRNFVLTVDGLNPNASFSITYCLVLYWFGYSFQHFYTTNTNDENLLMLNFCLSLTDCTCWSWDLECFCSSVDATILYMENTITLCTSSSKPSHSLSVDLATSGPSSPALRCSESRS